MIKDKRDNGKSERNETLKSILNNYKGDRKRALKEHRIWKLFMICQIWGKICWGMVSLPGRDQTAAGGLWIWCADRSLQ